MTVVIVDDEAMVREWFVSSIKGMHPDYQLIGTAHDGPSGLELCRKHNADIAVVDIKMPGMDGIELIRQLKSVCPQTASIVLSSYPNFDFARRALKAGATDYLLKAEITQESLREVLDQVISTATVVIEADSFVSAGSGRLSRMFRHEDEIPEHSLAIAVLLPPEQSNSTSEIPAVFSSLAKTVSCSGFCEFLGFGTFVGILCPQQTMSRDLQEITPVFANRLVNHLSRLDKQMSIHVGVDACTADVPGIWEKLTAALKAALRARVSSEVIGIQQFEHSRLEECYLRFIAELEVAELVRARHYIDELLELAVDDPGSAVAVLFDLVLRGEGSEVPARMGHAVQTVVEAIAEIGIAESLKQASEDFLKKRNEQLLSADPHTLAQTEPIYRALVYMSMQYHKDIGLHEVAQYIGLSAGYLSELFHQVTGNYFQDHLTELRITKAAELLSCTHVPIRRIGALVGYPNPSYFGQVFRRHFGISPGAYRKQHIQK